MNYKIRVNNEAESKEAQELFFELGAKPRNILENWKNEDYGVAWFALGASGNLYNEIVFRDNDSGISCSPMYKEITLPQLRDLVVLKRNVVGDKNVIDPYYNASLYLDSKGDLFVFHLPTKTWKESNLSGDDQTIWRLKPIEKTMKEYLDPRNGYKLIEAPESEALEPHAKDWIEVPHSAEVSYFFNGSDLKGMEDDIAFYKDDIGSIYYDDSWHKIDGEKVKDFVLSKGSLLWQRQAQPEELPSIGDEPSLNDQYAEIEEVREKHSHYRKDISNLDVLDIYRVTELFKPHSCGAHIAKKALCSGQRGHKDLLTDIQDIIDTAERWKQMIQEDLNDNS